MLHEPFLPRSLKNAADAALAFSTSSVQCDVEYIHAAYVTNDRQLLAVDTVKGLSRYVITLPIRHLIERTLELGGTGIVIAHNHPSGDLTPSAHDIAATRALVRAARPLDIRLLDHLIFANDRCSSFRALGLL